MLTKTKNIHKKSKKNFFLKIKKLVLRIVQKKLQMRFERNPCIRFRDNCDTDDGRTDGQTTDDGQKSHTMSSADRVKQTAWCIVLKLRDQQSDA